MPIVQQTKPTQCGRARASITALSFPSARTASLTSPACCSASGISPGIGSGEKRWEDMREQRSSIPPYHVVWTRPVPVLGHSWFDLLVQGSMYSKDQQGNSIRINRYQTASKCLHSNRRNSMKFILVSYHGILRSFSPTGFACATTPSAGHWNQSCAAHCSCRRA